jgi:hypothetical protein
MGQLLWLTKKDKNFICTLHCPIILLMPEGDNGTLASLIELASAYALTNCYAFYNFFINIGFFIIIGILYLNIDWWKV